MGFSLTKRLRGAISGALAGASVGGPFGAIAGAGVGFAAPAVLQSAAPTGQTTQTSPLALSPPRAFVSGAGLGGRFLPGFTPALARVPRGALPTLFRGGRGGTLGLLLDQASQATGRRVTARMVVEAARVCGIPTAAATFGLSETQICTIIVTRRRRRARGISAADLRRTRATIRKVTSLQQQLKQLSGPIRRRS